MDDCHYTLTAIPTASVPKDAADGAALGTFPVQVSLMWIEDIGTFKMRLAICNLSKIDIMLQLAYFM